MDGLLTPIDFRGFSDPIDRDALVDAIEARSRSRRVFQPQDDERTVQAMLQALDSELNGERRTLVFCASLAQMDRYQQLIPGSRTVSGRESRDEQVATVEAFNEGEFDVLLSRDVLNEGIDVPHANALIFLRNTESPVVFLQQLGRGMRRIEGKDRVLVLDFINNLERVEFVYSFFSRIRAAAARNGFSRAPIPPARFEFDQTARDIVRALIQKKLESGILVDLHGMSGALEFEVSAATLRHMARSGRLTPDYVEPRPGRPDAFYFTQASVRKFMRQVHAHRIPEGLLSLHEFAGLVGQNETAIRKLQRVGDLPASWIERRGQRLELYFSEADVIRHRTPPSLAEEAVVLADDADDRAEKEEILSLLDDLAPRAVIE
jgi:Helicase conserved C-terminal domain